MVDVGGEDDVVGEGIEREERIWRRVGREERGVAVVKGGRRLGAEGGVVDDAKDGDERDSFRCRVASRATRR